MGMKSPDEIKKALECCFYDSERCADCPYYPVSCDVELVRDAREYIRQLEAKIEEYEQAANKCCYESRCNAEINQLEALCKRLRDENEQLEAERDAAVKDMPTSCILCKHFQKKHNTCNSKKPCDRIGGVRTEWQWRGVQKEDET